VVSALHCRQVRVHPSAVVAFNRGLLSRSTVGCSIIQRREIEGRSAVAPLSPRDRAANTFSLAGHSASDIRFSP
jgi:hypothetical protein